MLRSPAPDRFLTGARQDTFDKIIVVQSDLKIVLSEEKIATFTVR